MISKILILLLISFITLWIYGFLQANDFRIKTKKISEIEQEYKKILVIFPHPDDEAMSMGGFLSKLNKENTHIRWVLLTKGEKGNENATFDEKLKEIRTNEANSVAKKYGIKELKIYDLNDNGIAEQYESLNQIITQEFKDFSPDLTITYDKSGLYGHPDHIAVSEAVTKINNSEIWYISYPKKILNLTQLPTYMASDKTFDQIRLTPTFKVFTGINGLLSKIKAIYSYESQLTAFKKSFPIKQIPLWFYVSLTPYEYFHEAN